MRTLGKEIAVRFSIITSGMMVHGRMNLHETPGMCAVRVEADFEAAPLELFAQRGGNAVVFRHEVERRAKAKPFLQVRHPQHPIDAALTFHIVGE